MVNDQEIDKVRSRKRELQSRLKEIRQYRTSWSEMTDQEWLDLKTLAKMSDDDVQFESDLEEQVKQFRQARQELRELKRRAVGHVMKRSDERRKAERRITNIFDISQMERRQAERRAGEGERRSY